MKPFWKTSEFWKSLAGMILPYLLPSLPTQWQAGLSTASAAAYAVSRGLAKSGK